MENLLLWLTGEKDNEGKLSGALIDATQVYDAAYIDPNGISVWAAVPGNTVIEIPKTIIWEDEEYDAINDMSRNDVDSYLDSLVGQEGSLVCDEYTKSEDCLVYDYYNQQFGNLTDWMTVKCYDYLQNTNLKTITLDTDGYGYNIEYDLKVISTYNLDYIDDHSNNTNFEYGGRGNHALLHKVVIDDDEKGLLWHEWSQWQGSELDSGYLLTAEEALEELENHPEIEEIREWLSK